MYPPVMLDGIECSWERVAEAPGRCVRAMQRIQEFESIMGDIPEVVAFVRDLQGILSGEVAETAWQAEASRVILDIATESQEEVDAQTDAG